MKQHIHRFALAALPLTLALTLALAMALTLASCGGGSGGGAPDATGISIATVDPADRTIGVGEILQITAAIAPPNAADSGMATWISDNEGVAAVSGAGLAAIVIGIAPGTAGITVATKDGRHSATCEVTVTPAPVAVEGVAVSPGAADLAVGATLDLAATIAPAGATNKNVTWASDSLGVATVSGDGLGATVTAVAIGSAKITVTTEDGAKTAWCNINVVAAVPVESVSVAPSALVLMAGGAPVTLMAAVMPANASNRTVAWTNGNPAAVGMAPDGLAATITPLAHGQATITVASAADPSKKAECAVTVVAQPTGEPAVYVAGFGLYLDGSRDPRIGDQLLMDVSVDAMGNTHAAGQRYNIEGGTNYKHSAAYFLNGAHTIPEMTHGDTFEGQDWSEYFQSMARSVFVAANGDVYVSGYEAFPITRWSEGHCARLWKNGLQVPLENVDEAGGRWTRAFTARLHGSDTWVGGTDYDWMVSYDELPYPAIWKNGKQTIIYSDGSYGLWELGIEDLGFDAAGQMYAIVHNNIWEDVLDNALYRINPDDLGEWTLLVGLDGDNYPLALFVDGTDVYAAGLNYYDAACYWKNGTARILPPPAGAQLALEADDVYVLDGHVYIVGGASFPDGNRIVQWIDGAAITDDRAFADTTEYRPNAVFAQYIARVPASAVTLDGPTLTVPVGYTGTLSATVLPPDATRKGVTWESGNPAVASISGVGNTVTINGLALSEQGGSVAITAKSPDGPQAQCLVSVVREPVTGVDIPPSMEVGLYRNGAIWATVAPATATNKNISWASDNHAVAIIGGGYGLVTAVRGMGLGTATITVTTEDGAKTDTCLVTVTAPSAPAIYMACGLGLYVDGQKDMSIGDQQLSDVMLDGAKNVHAVGLRHHPGETVEYRPAHYKNGIVTTLPLTIHENTNQPYVHGVWASDGHWYAVGRENSATGWDYARLWVDGQLAELQETIGGSPTISSEAYAVRERNGSHYVVGRQRDYSYSWHAAIWKDGESHEMPGASRLLDMAFGPAGSLHVLGISNAGYRAGYRVSQDLSGMTELPCEAMDELTTLTSIFVDGTDVYFTGWRGYDAYYWKNGERHMIERPVGRDWGEAHKIYVHEGHTYIAGISRGIDGYGPELWIDGANITDERAPQFRSGNDATASPSAIFVGW